MNAVLVFASFLLRMNQISLPSEQIKMKIFTVFGALICCLAFVKGKISDT